MKKIDMETCLDLLNIPFPRGKESFTIECPFCGSYHKNNRKTMNIHLYKYGDGVYSCLRCDSSGGVVNLWKEVKGFHSIKEAAKDIQKSLEQDNDIKEVVARKKSIKFIPEKELLDIENRDKTYNALLKNLVLTQDHYNSLRKRGLSDAFIKKKQYRSVPQSGLKMNAELLLDKGFIIDGVPGFYKDGDTWSLVKCSSGILIPQTDIEGHIQGFQIRLDNNYGPRYINLSSRDREEGTPSKTFVHMARGRESNETLILTEGALKADVISHLSGKNVLSVPGVNSLGFLPEALQKLKEKGYKKILIAFDMDLWDNPNVYSALCKLKNLLREADYAFAQMFWDKSQKGLDDFLFSKKSAF